VAQQRAALTRDKLIRTATELIRRRGFVATRIDDVCEIAGMTKGAFFHHFKTKEELAEACLTAWGQMMTETMQTAPFQNARTPRDRVLGAMDFFITVFDDPKTLKSCLVGTTVQEVSETHPQLRAAAHGCLSNLGELFKGMLDDACRNVKPRVDTASLSNLWIAAIQGSLILYKASHEPAVIRKNLQHMKKYIAGYLAA
jgi:TetR/AcrR family transcriptional regulator, transcriptional repressor for nem operon